MICGRCAREVTLGWMEIVSHRVNPRTGATEERLYCQPCADEVAGRTNAPAATRPVDSTPEEIVAALRAHIITVDGHELGDALGSKEVK